MGDNNNIIRYIQARKRVRKIKGFYIHLGIYILVFCIVVIQGISNEGYENWKEYSNDLLGMFLWGVGLAVHGISVFVPDLVFGKEWEKRKIKEIMEKNR